MIEINPVPAFRDNYIWLIVNIDNRTVAIVDPGDATPVIERLKQSGWTPVAILVTHHHPDHTGGINTLLQYYQIPVYGPAHESIPGMTHPLAEGDVIAPDGLDLALDLLVAQGPEGHGDGGQEQQYRDQGADRGQAVLARGREPAPPAREEAARAAHPRRLGRKGEAAYGHR